MPPKQFGSKAPPRTPSQPPTPGGAKQAAASARTTSNGLITRRYTDVTDQVRRMPLAVVVIADQAHIPEVETALANSRLRLQITQVNWQHFRGNLKEGADTQPKDGPDLSVFHAIWRGPPHQRGAADPGGTVDLRHRLLVRTADEEG